MIPPGRHGGRRRSVNVREVLNGIFTCCGPAANGRRCPRICPPKSTVHDYLELWNRDGTLERIHHALYVAVREEVGREASPAVAIIDSQTARGSKSGSGLDPSGYDAGKKIKVSPSGTSWSTRWSPVERCRSSRRRRLFRESTRRGPRIA